MNKLFATVALAMIFAVPALALAHHDGGTESMLTLRVLVVVFCAALVLNLVTRIVAAIENSKTVAHGPLEHG